MSDPRRFWIPGLAAAFSALTGLFLFLTPAADASPASDLGESFEERCGDRGRRGAISVEGRNGRYDLSVKRGRCRLEVELRGKIEFLPDESGVASMSDRARLEITEQYRGARRRLVATPGAGGEPVYDWSVDGRSADFDDGARAWLRQMLPVVFRTTGIDAAARVGRILARSGADAVLDEAAYISGDHVQRIYLEELLRQAELEEGQLEDVLALAAREIGSDFELAELLIGVAGELDAEALRVAYAKAATTIGSDFEMRRTLTPLIRRSDLGDEALDVALDTSRAIGSDFELAELLITVAQTYPQGRELPRGYAEAVRGIGSDFEHRRVLAAVLERDPRGTEMLDALLATADAIGSDFEMAELLIGMANVYPRKQPLPETFFTAVRTIGSDYEHRRVLDAVVSGRDLDAETVEALLESSSELGSDFEMAEFLIGLARAYPAGDELDAFSRALGSVGSTFERDRVRAATGRRYGD